MINHLSTGAGFLPSRITRSSCSQMRHLFLWPTCVKKEERVPCTTNPQMWTWPFRNASILGRKLDVEPKIPKQIITNHYISESRCSWIESMQPNKSQVDAIWLQAVEAGNAGHCTEQQCQWHTQSLGI